MSIKVSISRRAISSVLHFTTSDGFLGMISGEKKQVLPRSMLSSEKHLEFIATPNASCRSDTEWLNYVNLSISKINPYYFKYSRFQVQSATPSPWVLASSKKTS